MHAYIDISLIPVNQSINLVICMCVCVYPHPQDDHMLHKCLYYNYNIINESSSTPS